MNKSPQIPMGNLVSRITKWNPQKDAPTSMLQYIDISSIDREQKEIIETKTYYGSDSPSRARQLVRAADILVSTVRPNLNAVAEVPISLDGATASTGYCVLRPLKNELSQRYLFHWVQTPTFINAMVLQATGASYPAVTNKIVKASKIPLPPLPEQRRIAAILDKADELRAKRQAALDKLDTLLESIFLDMFGDPVTNPKGWDKVKFENLLTSIDSGWSPKCETRAAEGDEWGVLKLGAVTTCRYLGNENKALPLNLQPKEHLEVKAGDLLFSRKNTAKLVAACALVMTTTPKLMLSDLIFRFRLDPSAPILPEYLWALLTHQGKRREIQSLATGAAGSMPNISKKKLREVPIELPPYEMQAKFALAFAKCEHLRQLHAHKLNTLNNLFHSLQQRLFRN